MVFLAHEMLQIFACAFMLRIAFEDLSELFFGLIQVTGFFVKQTEVLPEFQYIRCDPDGGHKFFSGRIVFGFFLIGHPKAEMIVGAQRI